MDPKVKLFYAPGACSLAPHIALEETGAAFDAVLVNTQDGEHLQPAYRRINPKARVPALSVDGWILTENPAILQFVARAFPQAGLWPERLEEQARVAEWLAWFASTVHVAYAHIRRAERYATTDSGLQDVRNRGLETCRELWRAVEDRIGEGPWLVGEHHTVADAYAMVFWNWGRGPSLGFDMDHSFPNWSAQARRMARRPAVQRAFQREMLQLP